MKLRILRNDIFGGIVASVLTIAFSLSYSVLIFSGPLAPYLSYGTTATFSAAAIAAVVLALRSTFPFAIGGPDSTTAAVAGTLAAAVVEHIHAVDPVAPLLGPVLMTLAGSSIVTGIVLCAFGLSRMGRAIRYVPYPVTGGFLGATSCLILAGAVQVITGHRLRWATLDQFANAMTLYQMLAAGGMAMTIYVIWHRSRNPLALPAILVGGVVIAHIVFLTAGISIAQAQTLGWTFASPPPASLTLPWAFIGVEPYPWQALPGLVGNIIAVVFVTASSALFNSTGIEVATHREANLERELNTTGIANILVGAFGGYSCCISVSRSLLNLSAGGTTRLSGLTAAVVAALMLVIDPALLGYMPKCVLGGLLIYLGTDQLYKWIVLSRRRLSVIDYVSLLAIIVIIVQWGFIAGVLIGTVIGCATFALSVSRVSSIKYAFDASEYRSSLDRSLEDQRVLSAHGQEIQGLNLQSYLFFGSANRLYQHVKALLQRRPECRYLLFDFRLVTGIDSSAAHSFTQIKRTAHERGIHLVLVNLPASAERNLRSSQFIDADMRVIGELDHALEWCENEVIARHRGLEQEEGSLREWFGNILHDTGDAEELMRRCQRLEYQPGDVIAHAGEAADSMHFILEGRVGIMMPSGGDGQLTRVRSLGRYTTVGEMGLVAQMPRSATIQAEIASVLYVLRADAFDDLKRDHGRLSQTLLTYFIAVLGERLAFASRTITMLRR